MSANSGQAKRSRLFFLVVFVALAFALANLLLNPSVQSLLGQPTLAIGTPMRLVHFDSEPHKYLTPQGYQDAYTAVIEWKKGEVASFNFPDGTFEFVASKQLNPADCSIVMIAADFAQITTSYSGVYGCR